jgi:hypothetical protein
LARLQKSGAGPVKSRRIQEHATRNTCSRSYYSVSRNAVLPFDAMIEAVAKPIFVACGTLSHRTNPGRVAGFVV